MYWLRLGYWNEFRGFGQNVSIYIADDFKSFMMEDYDVENDKIIYVNNRLPEHINYDRKVKSMMEYFVDNFDKMFCADDVEFNVKGFIDLEKYEVDLPY